MPSPAPEVVHVSCPVGQTTTVVFPEALKQLRSVKAEAALLGLSVERTKPRGVISVRPTTASARGTIEFRGPTRVLSVVLEATAEGSGREVRVGEEPEAAPIPLASALPPAAPAPATTAPAPAPPALDVQGLLRATPVVIERREGLPGQRPMVLKDALQGDQWVWLRFRLEGGAAQRVERVWWEHGDIATYVQEAMGKDLLIVVQVPRASVTRKTRVSLKLAEGPAYRFGLSASTLTNFFKGLFK